MNTIIQDTIQFVKDTLRDAEGGHDWFHIERVYRNALALNKMEQGDELVVSLAALLHDIADSKFHAGDEEIGPNKAEYFLLSIGVEAKVVTHVKQIIQNVSFSNSFDNQSFNSLELQIVQDADRLDALGAIGIARTFTYGGYKNRTLYDPEIAPQLNHTKESYKNSSAPTLNHFYEKLLLLKDQMNTSAGKVIANERHQFMEMYLEQFYAEWRGER